MIYQLERTDGLFSSDVYNSTFIPEYCIIFTSVTTNLFLAFLLLVTLLSYNIMMLHIHLRQVGLFIRFIFYFTIYFNSFFVVISVRKIVCIFLLNQVST